MKTILLVEDDDEVRQLIAEMLRRRGRTVLEARDGPEALNLVNRNEVSISFLIADVVMPKMSGPELAAILAELIPNLKVLYISGYLEDQLREHGLSNRERNFLRKPFTQNELMKKLDEVLGVEDRPAGVGAGAGSSR